MLTSPRPESSSAVPRPFSIYTGKALNCSGMGRGTIAALVMFGLATPAMAADPCDPAQKQCRAKKERQAQPAARKLVKPEACVRRYALM